jgi:uncharacterized YccA/Bax inhibitor family protein
MSNPILNDDRFKAAAAAGDAQLSQSDRAGWAAPQPGTQWNAPITDGPISRYRGGVMTIGGTISASAILLGLLIVSGAFGWSAVKESADGTVTFPALAIAGIFVGIAAVFALMFKPQLAKWVAPVYAIAQGFAVGAISRAYESYADGIVIQAIGATLAVFLVMLFLYRTKIIKVTERYRRIVITATLGVMVFYGVSLLISLFGGNISFINSPSLLGIGLSVLVAGIAAANLALDFDFIEKGSQQQLPKYMEWYAAFGLLVTLVWLYLELLRLLAKIQRN